MKRIGLLVACVLMAGLLQPISAYVGWGEIVGFECSAYENDLPIGISTYISIKVHYLDSTIGFGADRCEVTVDNPDIVSLGAYKSSVMGLKPGKASVTVKYKGFTDVLQFNFFEIKTMKMIVPDSVLTGDRFQAKVEVADTQGTLHTPKWTNWFTDKPDNCDIGKEGWYSIWTQPGKMTVKCTAYGIWGFEKAIDIEQFQGERLIFDKEVIDDAYIYGRDEYKFLDVRNAGTTNVGLDIKTDGGWVEVTQRPNFIDAGKSTRLTIRINAKFFADQFYREGYITFTTKESQYKVKVVAYTEAYFSRCGSFSPSIFELVVANTVDKLKFKVSGIPGKKVWLTCDNPRFRFSPDGYAVSGDYYARYEFEADTTNPPKEGFIEGNVTVKTESECDSKVIPIRCYLVKSRNILELTIDKKVAVLNGKPINLAYSVDILRNHGLYVPFYSVFNALGAKIVRYKAQRSVMVTYMGDTVTFFDKSSIAKGFGRNYDIPKPFDYDAKEFYVYGGLLSFMTDAGVSYGSKTWTYSWVVEPFDPAK